MTVDSVVQLIFAACAVASVVISIHNRNGIADIHLLVNSRLSELLELTRVASKAEGVKEANDKEKPPC